MNKKETKIAELGNKYVEVSKELRENCVEYLTELVRRNNGKADFADYFMEECPLTIAYDGGNHPEYATNLYSSLYGMSLDNDGKLEFNIEDVDGYGVDRVSTQELWTIAINIIEYNDPVFADDEEDED